MAAFLGAVFGVGSTLLTDAVRSRRDLDQRWSETKRAVYVRFLIASTQAHSRMVMAAFSNLPQDERRRAVHDAFHIDPQYSETKSVLRELAITASDTVYRHALTVYAQLRDLRDVLAETSIAYESKEYEALNRPFFAYLDTLQATMRDDLQPVTRPRRRNEVPTKVPLDPENLR